jgi:hypothetical protein
MSDPMNKPSCETIGTVLPGNLSSKGVMFCDQEQDNEIPSKLHDSSNT